MDIAGPSLLTSDSEFSSHVTRLRTERASSFEGKDQFFGQDRAQFNSLIDFLALLIIYHNSRIVTRAELMCDDGVTVRGP